MARTITLTASPSWRVCSRHLILSPDSRFRIPDSQYCKEHSESSENFENLNRYCLKSNLRSRDVAAEFGRWICLECKRRASDRMRKSKKERVQSKPAKRILRAAISAIADNRMSHFRQVNSNLILSARLQGHFEHREIMKTVQNAIVSNGGLPFPCSSVECMRSVPSSARRLWIVPWSFCTTPSTIAQYFRWISCLLNTPCSRDFTFSDFAKTRIPLASLSRRCTIKSFCLDLFLLQIFP